MVSYLDILLVLILAWAIWRGWSNGFVAELFSFLAFFVGVYASVYLSEPVGKLMGLHTFVLNETVFIKTCRTFKKMVVDLWCERTTKKTLGSALFA